jgi:hypothetical protein
MAPGYTSYSIPGHLTPYGAFHEPPNQNEVGPNAGAWNTPAQPQSPDPAVATAIGAQPQGLHPMIQQALAHIQSMGLGNDDRSISPQGLGLHPQLDRFHAIHASQELAARMAELTQRSLASNQYRGRH